MMASSDSRSNMSICRRASSLASSSLAIVRVQRAAAGLRARRDDFAAVGQQHIGRVAVDIGEGQVLHAARQQAHAVPRRCLAGSSTRLRSGHPRSCGAMRGVCGSSSRSLLGSSRSKPKLRTQRAPARCLIQPHQHAHEPQQPRVHEEHLQRQPAPEVALPCPADARCRSISARAVSNSSA